MMKWSCPFPVACLVFSRLSGFQYDLLLLCAYLEKSLEDNTRGELSSVKKTPGIKTKLLAKSSKKRKMKHDENVERQKLGIGTQERYHRKCIKLARICVPTLRICVPTLFGNTFWSTAVTNTSCLSGFQKRFTSALRLLWNHNLRADSVKKIPNIITKLDTGNKIVNKIIQNSEPHDQNVESQKLRIRTKKGINEHPWK